MPHGTFFNIAAYCLWHEIVIRGLRKREVSIIEQKSAKVGNIEEDRLKAVWLCAVASGLDPQELNDRM
jgi:hypothetical protein